MSRVRPSNKGFIAVSEDGDENPAIGSGIKRPRGRPRKTVPEPVQVEDMTEPPPKKLRRPKTETDDVEVEVEIPSPARKRRGRAKKLDRQSNEDAGAEAEIEDDTTPVSTVT